MSRNTLFDKLWQAHVVEERADGTALLWVDRHLLHEGSHHAFAALDRRGLAVAHPELALAVADHYMPTRPGAATPPAREMMARLGANAARHGIRYLGPGDPRQGIVHVIGPELGHTLPGLLVVCGDSHTATHGAVGAWGFGIGATEVAHVLATQTIWQKRPRVMRLRFEGQLAPGVGAKDMALAWIARLGADGARGHVVEYGGAAVRALSMEGRMTLCNLSIEGGARAGLVAPDAVTLDWLRGRPMAPAGADWERAVADWARLAPGPDAEFDHEEVIEAAEIAPIVTWGTNPEQALPVTARVPAPRSEAERAALEYMGLTPGRPLIGTPVDQVFIGSCTNGRIEDLRAAAAVLAGRRARVPGLVAPGSAQVRARAEAEGLDRVFTGAGLEWAGPGCSMCVGMNGDLVAPGQRCASSTNRNFRGRQGPGARTHLMSPAMVAAAALAGALADVRPMLAGRS